jgi:hypothetical protein
MRSALQGSLGDLGEMGCGGLFELQAELLKLEAVMTSIGGRPLEADAFCTVRVAFERDRGRVTADAQASD